MGEIYYQNLQAPLEPEKFPAVDALHRAVFRMPLDPENLGGKQDLLFTLAWDGEICAGFFISYALKRDRYYLWMAGVDEKYRGQGIATRLIELLHGYCRENGYSELQLKTKNKWRNMLLFSIKNGFDVIGTYTDDNGEPKIILQKAV